MKTDEARALIRFYLRQLSGGYYPLKIRFSSKLAEFVDEPTAQSLYEEEIARIESRIGPLPRWDSEKKAHVAGTPKP